ncbi:aquaporin-like [Pectinophora gossypiella]|uniref:aquaporin-like n=1 Tax=Pectinophora gossypiella TaxID=13191 RepID=UPI00214ED323|nr:aquaporin-like [Pectinophora gossypiella]
MPQEQGAGAAWARRWLRALAGELVATALLVALGVGSLLPGPAPLTHPALGFGFVITGLVQAFGGVSGAHMNPAVTLAALICGQLPPVPALAYVLVQFVGAYCGFGLVAAMTPLEAGTCPGVTLPAPGVSAGSAVLVEALLTATLVAAVAGLWAAHDAARPDHAAPVKLGLTVAGLVYAGGKLTGASLNPARSLAPAHVTGCWRAHWVYWVGPLGGAAAAALLQRFVLAPPPPRRGPEELPLRDKPDH